MRTACRLRSCRPGGEVGRLRGGRVASRPRRDAQGRFVRSRCPGGQRRRRADVGVTTEDPGGESGASLGSSKAELNAPEGSSAKPSRPTKCRRWQSARVSDALLSRPKGGEPSAAALSQLALDGVDLVLKVATKSGSLKGTFTRGLKEAAADIKEAVGVLLNRTASDEVAKLQEENGRLRADLEDLRRQVAALSEQQQRRTPPTVAAPVVAPSPAPRPASARSDDEVERIVRGGVSAPPPGNPPSALAADARRRTEEPPRPAPRQGKPTGGLKKPGEGAPPSAKPTTAGSKGESWATVVGRKKARKAAKADSAAARAPGPTAKAAAQPARRTAKGGRKGPAVRAPRSEAVTLTLQPGAAERGVTYQSVIAEAKAKIKLSDLGLQSVTVRQTVTGARLFEVAGAASGSAEKADALAAKMREVLNPEDVRVSRPVKTAEVRITGLDDSVTPEEVVAAVARSGECPPDRVRAGDIRTDATGLGAVWVRCPVASAKKIALAGEVKHCQKGREEELQACRGNLAAPAGW
ncbi:uncharacterized protein LOC113508238 [Trichoplusia ni]|uniref:Uncharacterized protein LOC113508238 n=1 Tax=Trichoplusia ni TaxID=7111 RepID=A0A7E5X3N6_TRINI|nr:uncharacterized protein LOC113508238 [Trichoplusia ni]